MASPFYGGPERQVLGLATHLRDRVKMSFLSFAEQGRAESFLTEARQQRFEAKALRHNTPRYFACVGEVAAELRDMKADLLLCHGYKPDLSGWRAARRTGIPVISVSRGWTWATWKVRCYEKLDRMALRWMDGVVCVSEAQAEKVRLARVSESKITVIHNSKGQDAFVDPQPEIRQQMLGWFDKPPRWIIGAAGRLSPEKGYSVFVDAAAIVARQRPNAGFVLFGEGPLRGELERQVLAQGLTGRLLLAGFRDDMNRYLPNLDLHVMSSFTEGMPNVLLEASAAGVPTVATSVGGIPEALMDGDTGYLTPAGNAAALAERIVALLDDEALRKIMGERARQRIRSDFSFETMSQRYYELFHRMIRTTIQPGNPEICSASVTQTRS